jgi:hypothetical protein
MVTSPMPPVPAAPEQPATIFVALELSKARWLVGASTRPSPTRSAGMASRVATAERCWS